jgi:ATP-binding cassette subfamily F protein 3
VSHDRYFINQLANKIVVVRNQAAKVYNGNYSYYLNEKAKQAAAAAQVDKTTSAPVAVKQGKLDYQSQKQHDTEKRRLTRAVEQAEKNISKLEAQQTDLQNKMAHPAVASDFAKLQPLQEDLQAVQTKLDEQNQAWEQAMEALENFE